MVVVGADVHKRTHTFVAVDAVGGQLGQRTVEATTKGHVPDTLGRACYEKKLAEGKSETEALRCLKTTPRPSRLPTPHNSPQPPSNHCPPGSGST